MMEKRCTFENIFWLKMMVVRSQEVVWLYLIPHCEIYESGDESCDILITIYSKLVTTNIHYIKDD